MWRVFICTAGTCGLCICATSEMPLAQNCGFVLRAGNGFREFGREASVYGRNIDTDLLEHAALHDRHHAAAGVFSGLRRAATTPCARNARRDGPKARPCIRPRSLELGADAVAQLLEPERAREPCGLRHRLNCHAGNPFVCLNASPNTIAPACATLIERRSCRAKGCEAAHRRGRGPRPARPHSRAPAEACRLAGRRRSV